MILLQPIPAHWNYFLVLEKDIHALSRWIEFVPPNLSVYSIELARLLMTAAAEADVITKALCKGIAPAANADSIGLYRKVLLEAAPMLPDAMVEMPRYGMTLHPWSNWKKADSHPDWWTGNNKVKHHRTEHFASANLSNVLNAAAGLLVLLVIYYSMETRVLMPTPEIFLPKSFAANESFRLLLLTPDGTHFPWTR